MAVHCASKALNPGDIRANPDDHGLVPAAAVMNMVGMLVIVGVQRRHEPGFLTRDDQPFHFGDGVFQPHKQRAGDNRVADIQLIDTRQGSDGLGVMVMQPVARIDHQPKRYCVRGGSGQPLVLGHGGLAAGARLGISAGVQLNDRRAGALGRVDLLGLRVDE